MGALAGAAVIVGLAVLAPRASAYALLNRIQAAANALPEWHYVVYSYPPDGAALKVGEAWCRNGHIRDEEDRGRMLLFDDDVQEVQYRVGQDHALRVPPRRQAHEIQSLAGFVREMKASAMMTGLTIDRDLMLDGRRATRITAYSRNEPTRITMLADSATDVPFRATVEERRIDGWRLMRQIEIDTSAVTDAKVQIALPAGVTIVDKTALQRTWEERLSKSVAAYNGSGAIGPYKPVEIRAVWVNEDGVVFTLYTNTASNRPVDMSGWKTAKGPHGETMRSGPSQPPSPPILKLDEVTDDVGSEYVPIDGFQGTMYSSDGSFVGGLRWGAEEAQVGVFAPMRTDKHQPRSVKLRFAAMTFVVPPGFKPTGKWVTQDQMIPKLAAVAYHRQAVNRAAGQQPEWAAVLGMHSVPTAFEQDIAHARAMAADRRGDLPDAETQFRTWINLAEADMAENGQSYSMHERYELLGGVLAREGKKEEARLAFSKALQDAQGPEAERLRLEVRRLDPEPR